MKTINIDQKRLEKALSILEYSAQDCTRAFNKFGDAARKIDFSKLKYDKSKNRI